MRSPRISLTRPKLTREDEAAVGAEDIEVRRVDQEKINKFSTLHQKESALEDELKSKQVSFTALESRSILLISNASQQKEKEDLEEISTELELVDEEEKVP